MIYTVTLNPSLDYHVSVGQFELGETNRTMQESLIVGGKGLNVSCVLKNLGVESVALGFVAGFTGEEIISQLATKGIHSNFVKVQSGTSRINVKLDDIDGTEINGMGPVISGTDWQQFMFTLMGLKSGDVLVLSGSVPKGLSQDVYAQIIDAVSYKGVRVIVDAGGELLRLVLSKKPYLIKPNRREAEEILGGTILDMDDALLYAEKFVKLGAENVILSLGADGAVYANSADVKLKRDAYKGDVVSAVGAGDSMIAGFLTEIMRSNDVELAFEMAVLASAATAFSGELATTKNIENILAKNG